MLHKNKENSTESSCDEIVIDLNKCTDIPFHNSNNKRCAFSIDVMGVNNKGKSSLLNDLLRDMLFDSKGFTEDDSCNELDIEDQPRTPSPSRRRKTKL